LDGGARCTVFQATATPAAARKQWLAGVLEVSGELQIDQGAVQALRDGSSLLPVGVANVVGNFRRGDVVAFKDVSGMEIGRGLVEYSAEDAVRLVGIRSDQIENILGYRERATMVHRDELVLFDND
jgi:glutamate 5-kinase